jgi:hypothetical protein
VAKKSVPTLDTANQLIRPSSSSAHLDEGTVPTEDSNLTPPRPSSVVTAPPPKVTLEEECRHCGKRLPRGPLFNTHRCPGKDAATPHVTCPYCTLYDKAPIVKNNLNLHLRACEGYKRAKEAEFQQKRRQLVAELHTDPERLDHELEALEDQYKLSKRARAAKRKRIKAERKNGAAAAAPLPQPVKQEGEPKEKKRKRSEEQEEALDQPRAKKPSKEKEKQAVEIKKEPSALPAPVDDEVLAALFLERAANKGRAPRRCGTARSVLAKVAQPDAASTALKEPSDEEEEDSSHEEEEGGVHPHQLSDEEEDGEEEDEGEGEVGFLGRAAAAGPRLAQAFPTSRASIHRVLLRDSRPETEQGPLTRRDLALSGGQNAKLFYHLRALEQVNSLHALRSKIQDQIREQNTLAERRIDLGAKRGRLQYDLAHLDVASHSQGSGDGADAMDLDGGNLLDLNMRQYELQEEDTQLEAEIRHCLAREQTTKAIVYDALARFETALLRFQNDLVSAGLLAEATPDTIELTLETLHAMATLPLRPPPLEGFEHQDRREEPVPGAPTTAGAPDVAQAQGGREGFVCPVCLEYKGKLFGRLKKCNHVVCESCFTWLKNKLAAKKSEAKCPICKTRIGKSGFGYLYL